MTRRSSGKSLSGARKASRVVRSRVSGGSAKRSVVRKATGRIRVNRSASTRGRRR